MWLKSSNKEKLSELKYSIFGFFGLIIAIAIRVINLDVPLVNELHSFRQTETAIVIEWFLKDGISFFNYEMPVLGEPWRIIFEFPLYQAIVYGFMKLYGLTSIDISCKVISIFVFVLSAIMIYLLVEFISDYKNATIVMIVYLFMPYTIYWSRAALIDYTSVLFALVYSYCILRWINKPNFICFIMAIVFGCIAYLQKSTTMFPFVFILAYYIITVWIFENNIVENRKLKNLIVLHKNKRFEDIILVIMCVIPAIIGAFWVRHADTINSKGEFTAWITSKGLKEWNYGTFSQRLTIDCWEEIINRFELFFGSWFIFLGVMLIIALKSDDKKLHNLIKLFGIAVFVPVSILFNLFYVHDYYLISITPFIAVFIGTSYRLVYIILKKNAGFFSSIMTITFILIATIIANKNYLGYIYNPVKDNTNIGLFLKEITEDDDKIIIEGEDWNPTTPYYAERKCLMIKTNDWIQNVKELVTSGKYSFFLGHNLDTDSEILSTVSTIEAVPISNDDLFIYKVINENEIPLNILDNSVECDENQVYDISKRKKDYIYLEYNNIARSFPITIVFVEEINGVKFAKEKHIGLLSSKDGILIDVNSYNENATGIIIKGIEEGTYKILN